eukprot:7125760-Pyramimonas_sp.AAC.1
MDASTRTRKSSRRTSSRKRSAGKFAKTALKKGVVVNAMSGETKQFPVGTTVADIRNTLYPGT